MTYRLQKKYFFLEFKIFFQFFVLFYVTWKNYFIGKAHYSHVRSAPFCNIFSHTLVEEMYKLGAVEFPAVVKIEVGVEAHAVLCEFERPLHYSLRNRVADPAVAECSCRCSFGLEEIFNPVHLHPVEVTVEFRFVVHGVYHEAGAVLNVYKPYMAVKAVFVLREHNIA